MSRYPAPARRVVAAGSAALLLSVVAACGGEQVPRAPSVPTGAAAAGERDAAHERVRRVRIVPAATAPTLKLQVTAGAAGGWDLRLVTTRFRFAPGHRGGRFVPGEGHAHLYLDGRQLAHADREWYHLAAAAVPAGVHTLTVELATNDHAPYAVNGTPVAVAVHVGGARGVTGGRTGAGGHSAVADRTIAVTVTGGSVRPEPRRETVRKGERVRITVTSDRADLVRVRGYRAQVPVGPDRAGVVELVADQVGTFTVETRSSGTPLFWLQVRP